MFRRWSLPAAAVRRRELEGDAATSRHPGTESGWPLFFGPSRSSIGTARWAQTERDALAKLPAGDYLARVTVEQGVRVTTESTAFTLIP